MPYNKSQIQAINHPEGPCLVVAGPGSGKTAVLTQRIAHLIKGGVSPSQILVVTFTKAAASGMKARFLSECKFGGDVFFGTFHSLFFTILRESFGYDLKSVISSGTKKAYYRDILFKYGIKNRDMAGLISDIDSEISTVKAFGTDIEAYEASSVECGLFKDIYKAMARKMKENGMLDFDDMQYVCRQKLTERPDILNKWQEHFRFILVDEFQDINPVQYDILKMLGAPNNNVFCVGDDDQLIYGFRGSDPSVMKNFKNDYPDGRVIFLNVNYRSGKEIVRHAGCLINKNKNRYDKLIKAGKDFEGEVNFHEYEDTKEEIANLCDSICDDINAGTAPSDIAVIYRTNNEGSYIAKSLAKAGITYNMQVKINNPYENGIVGDVLCYLRLASSKGTYDRKDILQILDKPQRHIPREVFAEKVLDSERILYSLKDEIDIYDKVKIFFGNLGLLSRLSPFAAVNFVYNGMGYKDYAVMKGVKNGKDKADILEILDFVKDDAAEYRSYDAWIREIKIFSERFDNENSNKKDDAAGVFLMTMHASKGLEYRKVYIINAIEGITPYKKAITNIKEPEDAKNAIEEERRLFYVALTRAKESACILSVKNFRNKAAVKSRFIREMKEKEGR